MIEHAIETIAHAPVHKAPFPYFFVENIFPDDFYQELIHSFPSLEYYRKLSSSGVVRKGTYDLRFCLPLEPQVLNDLPFFHMLFWTQFTNQLIGSAFVSMLFSKFETELKGRFKDEKIRFQPDLGLISDQSEYAIGPHTDHPQKVFTLLFYFPVDHSQKNLGTSIYMPKDPDFRCTGLKHHPFEAFTKTYTAPFIPNSMFGFFKSDVSFHGVEPLGVQNRPRNLLSYQLLTDGKCLRRASHCE